MHGVEKQRGREAEPHGIGDQDQGLPQTLQSFGVAASRLCFADGLAVGFAVKPCASARRKSFRSRVLQNQIRLLTATDWGQLCD